jgi:sugar O-acyltransferase (sialic acid O-acetyltransferase NeuD family)
MKVAYIGFGELGKYLAEVLKDVHGNEIESVVYFDDVMADSGDVMAFPFDSYRDEEFKDFDFYICLGYKHLTIKGKIIRELISLKRSIPNFIHSSSYVHPSVKMGGANFIYPGVNIDRGTIIGNGTWIANGDIIPHDCSVGDCCWFGANVVLSGKVSIDDRVFIGSGTTVANDVTIGMDVVIGMASAVTKDIGPSLSVIGNPMRVIEKGIKLK